MPFCFCLREKYGERERTRALLKIHSTTLWTAVYATHKYIHSLSHVNRWQIFQLFGHCQFHTCQHVPHVGQESKLQLFYPDVAMLMSPTKAKNKIAVFALYMLSKNK